MREARPGTWYLRAYDRLSDRQVRRTFNGSKRQAQSELARLVAEVESGSAPRIGTLTVAGFLDRWLDHIRPTRQPGTIRSYEGRVKRLKVEIGAVRLSKLNSRDVDKMYADLLAGGMSPATLRMHHAILAAALHQAVKWDLVAKAATDNSSPPRVDRFRSDVPSVATIRALVAQADRTNPVLSAAIMLAAVTGCRRGELCGLRWSDVDRDRRVVHVRRSVKLSADGYKVMVGSTKTHQSRKVSLDEVMLAVLDTHRGRTERWAAEARVEMDPEGYILTNDPTGKTPINPDVITRAFVRLAARAGITCRFHDLRHFTATQLIAGGHDPAVVAGRLGHGDANTTLRLYTHALEERDRAAASALGALIAADS